MAAARPLVSVHNLDSDMATDGATNTLPLPDVMKSSIRPDIITFVHTNMPKNSRQPHAVSKRPATRPPPSPGVPAAPSPVSPRSRRHSPRGPRCLRNHVRRRPHVRPDEDLAPLAPPQQRHPEALRRRLRHRRLRRSSSSWLVATESSRCQRFLSLLAIRLRESRRPLRQSKL
ncbi:60S ribosomal protein L4 [Camellia lanceoleosa]|nr:60S ribosomal protein L4 [Camellia lanceoleosa]